MVLYSLGSGGLVAILSSHLEARLPDSLVEFKARISTIFPRVFGKTVDLIISISLLGVENVISKVIMEKGVVVE